MTKKSKTILKNKLKKALKLYLKNEKETFKEYFSNAGFTDHCNIEQFIFSDKIQLLLSYCNIEQFIFSDKIQLLLSFGFYAIEDQDSYTSWNEVRIYPLSRKTENRINKETNTYNCFSLIIDSNAYLETDSEEHFIEDIINYEEKARKINKIINNNIKYAKI